eukprot:825771_1
MFGMDDATATHGMSFEMNSLPLDQSMTVSDIDWKNDLDNVIAEDEKQFTTLPEQDTDFDDPKTLYEQSWGLYFAQRSGAMGDITGTSMLRPQFSAPNSFSKPYITSMVFCSHFHETHPDRLSTPSTSFPLLNRQYLPQLFVEDLMQPAENSINQVNVSSNNTSNLLRQFDAAAEDSADAIARRHLFQPETIINHNEQPETIMNSQIINDIKILKMKDIKQVHRFIQFHVNTKQINARNIDQECKVLLHRYVTKLQNTNSDVNSHTSRINLVTNQCTFHLLVEHNTDRKTQWSQLFLDMCKSCSWLESSNNQVVFSQLTPQ